MISTTANVACWLLCSLILLGISPAWCLGAEPYVPTDDNEVLETLPRSILTGRDELVGLRRQLNASPTDELLATKVAGRYMHMGNAAGDPRFYGYARAAIQSWWDAPSPPAPILKLRAKLQEKDHQYDAALRDLHSLVSKQPRDAQAWIEIANIYRVQGKYEDAQHACDSLSEFADLVPNTLCQAPLWAVTGRAEEAYASLSKVLPEAQVRWPSTVQWIVTMQTQISQALGRDAEVEQHLLAGLKINSEDAYLLRTYADFLLDQHREVETIALLRDHTADNGILLRAAIAARRAGPQALAAEWTRQLTNRFEEIRLRGGQPHGRFEARYELELNDNPQRALTLALANWQKQKEFRDTRNVLESAIAAKDRPAAEQVIAFLARNQTQDAVLQNLVSRLGAQ